MKKLSLKNLFLVLPVLLALVSGVFLFNMPKTTSAETLTELPSYFSVYTTMYKQKEEQLEGGGTTYVNYYSEEPEDISTDAFTNGDAIFLQSKQAIILKFDQDKLKMPDGTFRISQEITFTISINGRQLSVTPIENGFDRPDATTEFFKLAINPSIASADNFEYGKYSISLSYWYLDDNYDAIPMSFTCDFYVLPYANYLDLNAKEFATKKFNNAYFYNYSGKQTLSDNVAGSNLYTLRYKYKYFNVNINKVYQDLSYTTNITYTGSQTPIITNTNEMGAVVSTNYVDFAIDPTNPEFAVITFNDLGVYYISYETINPYNTNEVFTEYFNVKNMPNTGDTVYVYGAQAFYTSNNTLTEFKNRDAQTPYMVNSFAGNPSALIQADISYLSNISVETTDTALTRADKVYQQALKTLSQTNDNKTTYFIPKTNQAPIYFNTNATLNTANSLVYYFATESDIPSYNTGLASVSNNQANSPNQYYKDNYSSSPLSKAGIYFVQLAYSFDRYSKSETLYQYFMFEITNESPKLEIVEQIDNGDGTFTNGEPVANDYFTYRDVKIKKAESGIFDSPSVLTVYKSTTFNVSATNFTEKIVVNGEQVFSDSAKYMVELSYGNNNQKKYITYFTIDKTGISDISLSNAINTSSTLYAKGSTLNGFLTNGAVALSWLNKEANGKAKTYAEYKYFPTSHSSTFDASLSSDVLKNYYTSPYTKFGIPSSHTFAYTNGELPVSAYSNTIGMNVLSSANVLSDGGLYIIKIYDQTALTCEVDGVNVKYVVVFIDKTQTHIITEQAENWTFATDSKTVSTNYSLYFGKFKLIQFEQMSSSSTNIDYWLNSKVLSSNDYANYFVNYKDKQYLKINTNSNVLYTINSDTIMTLNLSETNQYSITINALHGTVPNENQYEFFAISNSNNNIQNTIDYYKSNYSARHQVTFSTDNSNLTLRYTNQDGYTSNLQQFSVNHSGNAKYNYYQPTNQNTLKNSGEILSFLYSTRPTTTLTVDKIVMEYYDFTQKLDATQKNGTYTFEKDPTTTLTIYQHDGANVGTSLGDDVASYIWQLNTETYNITANATALRTKAGKYVITRTYTSTSAQDSNDPSTRVLSFIVDRNGIISAPTIDSNLNKIYFAGGGIKLQVLNNYQSVNEKTLFFHDIYFASQMTQSQTASPVLVTNLLPVTVYVPAYKYGYEQFDTNTFKFVLDDQNSQNDAAEILTWKHPNDLSSDKNNQKYYSGYQLSAIVEYRGENNSLLSAPIETYNLTKALDNNYLTTSENTGLLSFSKKGYYRVKISSKSGDVFNFDFQIEYASPDYQLLDVNNNALNKDSNGIFYTNKSTVRISWQDSASEFLARINQDAISYKIENGPSGTINPQNIVSVGNNAYYVDLNLNDINSYRSGAKIDITLQFNGNRTDYNNAYYFSKTTSIIIDLDAPISNINNLIAQTGLSFNTLRQYYNQQTNFNKYNMSKQDGLYKHFSYVIDVSCLDFENQTTSLIKTPEETNYDYYKAYYRIFDQNGLNTKYVLSGVTQESDIYLDNYNDANSNTLYTGKYWFVDFANQYSGIYSVGKYIELIEEDYAGNRTVYTVYLSDTRESQDAAFSYKSLTTSATDTCPTKTHAELQQNMDLYSKYSLSLESLDLLNNSDYLQDRYYQVIKVGNNTFIKTPFSNGLYHNTLNEGGANQNVTYTLSEITTLSSNDNSQQITLYSVPGLGTININAYVLNKVLEYYTLSQYENDETLEGIVIKLPENNASAKNILYASKLDITAYYNNEPTPYPTIDENYLKEQQKEVIAKDYKITYIQGTTSQTYMRFEITRNINQNSYFVYKFTDNFGEEYHVIHIYGQTEIKNPITSDGDIITSYNQDGSYVYYSSENITYSFDTTIYSKPVEITFSHGGKSNVYRITKEPEFMVEIWRPATQATEISQFIEIEEDAYKDYFGIAINGSIMSIEMKQETLNPSNNKYGNSYSFAVKLSLNENFGTQETDTKYFTIFNKIPKITLMGENGENITSILGNHGAYTNNVLINFEKTNIDCPYDLYLITPDGTVLVLTQEYLAKEDGTYKIVVNYLGDLKGISKTLEFTIKNNADYKYSVMKINPDGTYTEIFATGNEYHYTFASGANVVTKTEQVHYIVNADYTIFVNDSLDLIGEKEPVQIVDQYTKIYVIHTDYQNTNLTEYYSVRFAVTQIPESYSLFKENDFVEYDSTGNSSDLTKFTSSISPVLTKDGYEIGRKIAWNKYYLIPENLISADIYYGEIGGTKFHPNVEETADRFAITLKTSGVYYFKFSDLAGNSHFFGVYNDTEYFSIKYLSSVIFEINEETPINYAIYDKPVTISVPSYTLSYYDANAYPTLKVERNGKALDIEKNSNYSWTFEEAGFYKVTLSAKISGESIYEPPIYFTILSSSESRTVFSYTSYGEYYIEDILLNGVSVNNKLANPNSGNMHDNKYLKDLSLHKNDVKTGEGVWTFIINTNNDFEQKFSFSVWINHATVPMVISHETGSKTYDNIIITFSTKNLLNEAGDCILKISGREDMYITQDMYDAGELLDSYEIILEKTLEYHIEVTTLSGQLLFSSYIVKAEPLNTISIIIIVVAAILLVAFIILFTLLRKKMKVK